MKYTDSILFDAKKVSDHEYDLGNATLTYYRPTHGTVRKS